ncbi:MAG: hypothetical protein U5R31_03205 [Acidimicrobiia bacterium]|nr:hypothetical protein [Acidimicrobiia bacterium]
MQRTDLATITDHARRCDAAWAHRFASVGMRDMWQAFVRTHADLAGITVGDRDQVAMVVAASLLVDSVSVQLGDPRVQQDPGRRIATWSRMHRDAAAMPAQLVGGALGGLSRPSTDP